MTGSLVIQYTPKQRPVSFQLIDICTSVDSRVSWTQIFKFVEILSQGEGGRKAPERIPPPRK
jgi:hypothetical protein